MDYLLINASQLKAFISEVEQCGYAEVIKSLDFTTQFSEISHVNATGQTKDKIEPFVGMKVKHDRFGAGVIRDVIGTGHEQNVEVQFDSA